MKNMAGLTRRESDDSYWRLIREQSGQSQSSQSPRIRRHHSFHGSLKSTQSGNAQRYTTSHYVPDSHDRAYTKSPLLQQYPSSVMEQVQSMHADHPPIPLPTSVAESCDGEYAKSQLLPQYLTPVMEQVQSIHADHPPIPLPTSVTESCDGEYAKSQLLPQYLTPVVEQVQSIHADHPLLPLHTSHRTLSDAYNYQQKRSLPSHPPSLPPVGAQDVYPPRIGPPPQPRPIQGPQDASGGTWWYIPAQPRHHNDNDTYTHRLRTLASAADSPAQQQQSDSPYPPSAPDGRSPSPSYTANSKSVRATHQTRREYHPKPAAQRSEWVMWVGNLPSDAEHDELWRFFTRPLDSTPAGGDVRRGSTGGEAGANRNGVLSIFLISRSGCAFVNYEAEDALRAGIARFDGLPLRAADARCMRTPLVCRVRGEEEDLLAGVGGQRGRGLHRMWVEAQAQSLFDREYDEGSAPPIPTIRPSGASRRSSSASSVASTGTTSSLLRRHFPQRFFILKSLTRVRGLFPASRSSLCSHPLLVSQDVVDLSVRSGVWVTQRHNEGVLDLAFRTAQDVFLVFSVNKSGGFYGYARMAGAIGEGVGGARDASLHSARLHSTAAQERPSAAKRRVRHTNDEVHPDGDVVQGSSSLHVKGAPGDERKNGGPSREENRGQDFKLQWICTDYLPFRRTRHLRNPWNRDLEVKISRDGTELEPSVGQALLQQFGAVEGPAVQRSHQR
ncbi:YT521-B-like domain-containing protein [Mycena galericulata]|nr:YT521-B-like domain-containing protein [Mycena galericulata]